MNALLDDAARRQRQAADPAASVWVSASAGTGKTKVLTDRVLALLLAGNPPQRILCLTFTKAAAAEMSNRIAGKLGHWATAPQSGLESELRVLLGRPPGEDEVITARRLFARVLDCPGGLRMQTIHAFCQSLLRRFPLEAGLAPHFQVMDDRDAGQLLEDARDDVLRQAHFAASPRLADALALIVDRIHEQAFPELMADIVSERGRIQRLLHRHGGVEGTMAAIMAHLQLRPGDTPEQVRAEFCDGDSFDGAALRRAASVLLEGSKTDQKAGQDMAAWLAAPAPQRRQHAENYCLALLTRDGTMRARLPTKGVQAAHPWLPELLEQEAERMIRFQARLKAAQVAEATQAVLVLADALLTAYGQRKQVRAVMDYDDLILTTRRLLAQPGIAPWVLFKLDGGLDHVLIDEAQDTNPDQWAVVAALTEEFFAGEGAASGNRTVFAVGDGKQSIYSFQRADPREFEAMRQRFARLVPDAQREWREIPLNLSFRSTQAVLDGVNQVFAPGQGGRDGVAGTEDITHLAYRQGQAGMVEIWPPIAPLPLDEPDPWKPPVERIRGDSPATRLARLLARRMRDMIGKDRLTSRNRPVRAGDILVLVRRRGAFVEDLVRELKALDVPVAGADRMVLAEQMAVMDLVALAQCLLLPEDDLTLATVLKGPLLGCTEEDLFQVAWNRGQASLWQSLTERRHGHPRLSEAYQHLVQLQHLAQHLNPHAFFAHVLGPLGGKQRLLARLGQDAEDPLDEFLNLTLLHDRSQPPSLQGFLHWLGQSGADIKRDLDQGGQDAVRIMTVHGSKGLQAPIVFLPDTLQVPTQSSRLLWDGDMLLWPWRAEMCDPVSQQAREAQKQAREQEYRRLLYVALTRAEDRLVVCGYKTRREPSAGCWYNLIREAVAPLAERVEDRFLAAQGQTESAMVLRLCCAQQAELPPPAAVSAGGPAVGDWSAALPDWAQTSPAPEPSPPRPLAPSRPSQAEQPARSPLTPQDAGDRFRRGTLIHTLLQILPDLPTDRRSPAMRRYLVQNTPDWDSGQQLSVAQEVQLLLDHPDFARLFGPGSRAEVPIVGLIGDHRVMSGQVDRLWVGEQEVLVVDYKTNRRPPDRIEQIPPLYVQQMAAYRLALACIYPNHRIRCALVWTDGPRLMEIPGAVLDDALIV